VGTAETLKKLQPILKLYPTVSTADLIVLAGITALEDQTDGLGLPFCGGYVDAMDGGAASQFLAPRLYPTAAQPDYVLSLMDDFLVKGLSKAEGVVLACRGNVGSQYFVDLIAGTGGINIFDEYETALLDDEFIAIVNAYAADDGLVKTAFAGAWTKMMTAGRYGSFRQNACDGVSTATMKTSQAQRRHRRTCLKSPRHFQRCVTNWMKGKY
jgi:Peroxidase